MCFSFALWFVNPILLVFQMMWRRTLQPQALNLVRVLPVDNATWISARISPFPQLVASARYWAELRDDVLILYPLAQLFLQHHKLVSSPPKDYPHVLNALPNAGVLETMPTDHVLSLAELVPSAQVVAFVLTSVRLVCREQSQTICLRSPRVRRPAAHILFDSSLAVVRWREDFTRAIFRDRKRLSDFRVLRHVGKGASGRVYEVEDKITNERMALKVIEKTTVFESKDTYRHAMDERLVLQMIRHHPYILDLHYAFQNAKRLFLVTEFCPGGDLFEYMNRRVSPLDENTARFISAQVLLALSHLHDLGIVYRDLKLENILIDDDGHIRLADFGLTKVLRQHDGSLARTNTFCGTREYVAPEMLRGDPYDTSLDFWTFGILLYEMMSGRTPFYTSDHSEIYRRIEKSPVFYPRNLSTDVRSLIGKLLVREPRKRIGSTRGGIASIKKHAWYKSIDWDAMMDRDTLESPLKSSVTFQQRKHEKRSSASSSTQSTRPRRKNRKELKQERALANVLADVQADLRYASSRIDRNGISAGSMSGSLLGLGRPRSPAARSADIVLAGYSFSEQKDGRAVSDSAGAFSVRSTSALSISTRTRWCVDVEEQMETSFRGGRGRGRGRIRRRNCHDVFEDGASTSCGTTPTKSPVTWHPSVRFNPFSSPRVKAAAAETVASTRRGTDGDASSVVGGASEPSATDLVAERTQSDGRGSSTADTGTATMDADEVEEKEKGTGKEEEESRQSPTECKLQIDSNSTSNVSELKRVQSDSPTCIRTPIDSAA